MSKRYLVTGGAGFIGAGVVHALLGRGDEVVVIDSGAAAGFDHISGTAAHIVRADIRDKDAVASSLRGVAAVVHLAAQASVPESIARPLDDMDINVAATLGLLEAARSIGGIRVVFASSNAVIGGHPPPAREGQVPYPVSPYGAAKASIEAYLRAYGDAYGLEAVALRFANAYGPWSAHKTSANSAFVKAYLAGGPLTIRGTGTQTRDFVYLDDVVSVVLACLDAPAKTIRLFEVAVARLVRPSRSVRARAPRPTLSRARSRGPVGPSRCRSHCAARRPATGRGVRLRGNQSQRTRRDAEADRRVVPHESPSALSSACNTLAGVHHIYRH